MKYEITRAGDMEEYRNYHFSSHLLCGSNMFMKKLEQAGWFNMLLLPHSSFFTPLTLCYTGMCEWRYYCYQFMTRVKGAFSPKPALTRLFLRIPMCFGGLAH